MSQAQKIPFLKLFSAWRPSGELAALTGGYLVTGAVIDQTARSIRARVECARTPEESVRRQIERSLALAYQCGWTPLLRTFMMNEAGRKERLEQFHVHEEGGVSATIRGETAILGTAQLLRKMSVRLPRSLERKDAIYLSLDGQLSSPWNTSRRTACAGPSPPCAATASPPSS